MPAPLASLFDGLSSIFGGTTAELRKRVEKGSLNDAIAYYAQHKAELNQSKAARPWIDKLAERLNQHYAPEYLELAALLQTAAQPELPPANWFRAREAVSRSEALLQIREGDPLLRQPAYALPAATALQAQVQHSREILSAAAPAQFTAFALNTPEGPQAFFATYPIDFDAAAQRSLALGQLDALIGAMPRQGLEWSARTLAFFAQLQPTDEKALVPLLDGWHAAYAKDRGWSSAQGLTLEQKIESGSELKRQVPTWKPPLLRVTLIPILGEKLSPQRRQVVEEAAREAGARWGANVQPGMARDAAVQQLSAARSQPIDMVVLFEGGRVVAMEGPGEPTRHQARYLARHASQPNPALARLRSELAEAEADWRQAEQQAQQAQAQAKQIAAQSRSVGGAFGVLALIGTSEFSTAAQKSRVTQLTQELGQTPATISTPVYEAYERLGTKKRLLISAPAALYLYEPKKQQLAILDTGASASRDYTQFDAPHPNDQNPGSLRSETPQSIIDSEGQALLRTSLEKVPNLLAAMTSTPMNWSADDLQMAAKKYQAAQQEALEKQKESLIKQ